MLLYHKIQIKEVTIMDYVTLGSTGIKVNKNGFGALPLQRITEGDAVLLLKKAYDNGITFYDTARFYTDSEKKIGIALSSFRDKIFIATKTTAKKTDAFWEDLKTSLGFLRTGYADIYQFHMAPFCPKPGDGSGLYEAMLEAKAQGKIRHIGITCHKLHVAIEAAESGLYETIQYPISYLSTSGELDLIRVCKERNIGLIGMKALAGGIITNSAAAYAFLMQFDNVLPIWGVQFESELDEFLKYQDTPPSFEDPEIKNAIERDIAKLSEDFCRGCGYCMPCPAGIEIPTAARMSVLLVRTSPSMWLTENWRKNMAHAVNCTNCGRCTKNCPYELDAPRLIRESFADYQKYL